MSRKPNIVTVVSTVGFLSSILLACVVVYEQSELASLAAQIDRLNKDLVVLLEKNDALQRELDSLENSTALLLKMLEHLNKSAMFFEKSVYYPNQEVFWDQKASAVPLTIVMLDNNLNCDSVTIGIYSSYGSQKLPLRRISPGIFSAAVDVTCPGVNETATQNCIIRARYGDRITAIYNDLVSADTLFAFPKPIGEDGDYSIWETWTFDPYGVPLVNYGRPIGLQYNPLFVAGYALSNYGEYLNTGNASFREKFFDMADWFVENAHQKGNFSVWEYDFPWPWGGYNVTVPYVSGLAQGTGMSVLIRAYFLSRNSTYLEICRSAMMSFDVEMCEGGVRYTDSDGTWYEEIADKGATSGKVLNGFLSALINLYEYYFGLNDALAYRLFLEGANTLSRNLYQYDTGSWSYYDLLHHGLASSDYHRMHIEQLDRLFKLTNDETFLEYSNRFQSYLTTDA